MGENKNWSLVKNMSDLMFLMYSELLSSGISNTSLTQSMTLINITWQFLPLVM